MSAKNQQVHRDVAGETKKFKKRVADKNGNLDGGLSLGGFMDEFIQAFSRLVSDLLLKLIRIVSKSLAEVVQDQRIHHVHDVQAGAVAPG